MQPGVKSSEKSETPAGFPKSSNPHEEHISWPDKEIVTYPRGNSYRVYLEFVPPAPGSTGGYYWATPTEWKSVISSESATGRCTIQPYLHFNLSSNTINPNRREPYSLIIYGGNCVSVSSGPAFNKVIRLHSVMLGFFY